MKRITGTLLTILLLGGVAHADIKEQLETCSSLADAESRLACFDAIGRSAESPISEAAPPVTAPTETVLPEAAPTDMPAAVPPAPPTAAPPPPAPEEEFGAESVRAIDTQNLDKEARKAARDAEKEAKQREKEMVVEATIVKVRKQVDGRFSVTLDNGQVWQETMGSRVGTPKSGATVELKRSGFGGYRMNIEGIYRTAWVKRTK